MREYLGPIEVNRKTGAEMLHINGEPTRFSLKSFWQWSASDLLSNALRGILAEYIVACDLGIHDGVRDERGTCDFRTRSGVTVDVKSAAYLQSWAQKDYSQIRFSISPTRGGNPDTDRVTDERIRRAQAYVFCLLDHKDKRTVDPLDLNQWRFFVVPTRWLNERFGKQKQISLKTLLELGPVEARFGEIGDVLERLVVE